VEHYRVERAMGGLARKKAYEGPSELADAYNINTFQIYPIDSQTKYDSYVCITYYKANPV
jgi:hypothetical protein